MGNMKLRTDLVAEAISIRDSSIDKITPAVPSVLENNLPRNACAAINTFLSEEELKITSLDTLELLESIRTKSLTCEAVTRAFLRRAAVAQRLTNCVTELLPDEAIARAKYLDSLGEPLGPLHGLPISIKEHIGMAGRKTNASVVAFIPQSPADKDQRVSVNSILLQAGAVLYARTTQPQSIMHLETASEIYGTTVNPYNISLTAGGSSGGEGALIGCRGSVLGVGSDIGGSIRSPAANCGIYGFKPTAQRIGGTGSKRVFGGQEGVLGTQGPMSTSRSGLELFMKTYLSYEPWLLDDNLVPLPWRPVSLPPTLKIAVMWSDNIVTPHPPVQRALREVIDQLKKAGIELVDWIPKDHDQAWTLTHQLYYEDGGKNLKSLLEEGGEAMLPLTEWILDSDNVKYRTAEEVCNLKVKRNAYRAMYRDHWLQTGKQDGHPVDAILCPVGPGAAPPLNCSKYWPYTSQWNFLDYPGAVFPVTTVDEKLDPKDTSYVPMNEKDEYNYSLYEPSRYRDAPVCLQVVTGRFEDEKCLAVLEVIEKAMGRA